MKYSWYYRKPLRQSRKTNISSVPREVKPEEVEMSGHCSSFSHSESYSPTSPVRRPQNDAEENVMMPSYTYDHLSEGQHEDLQEREPYGGSPTPSNSSIRRDTCADMSGPPLFDSGSPRFPDMGACPADISSIAPIASLTQRNPNLTHSFNMSNHPGGQDREPALSSFHNPSGFATSSPIESNRADLTQTLPDDPLNWSVEHVILFLNNTDPHVANSLSRHLRRHDIDGKALLLLNNELAMKYMGLKLGTCLKLCHYIEKLKEEKS
ncbi:PREDICTED: sex comb on midleg-like protein 1 [Chinchilla lanigera]|uniref:sex comb on midleg-like protein 1 n=1 Tax=Chinchilla lanigera TaxID=34839 RepID=UPI00038EAE99|nr:PREDICTED: sex comb on midleg-like protein 1 [Chinchilla lanigera]